jgi:hypothetical protein
MIITDITVINSIMIFTDITEFLKVYMHEIL